MSLHGPILPLVEYISVGEKPRLMTGDSVALPPAATAFTAPKSSSLDLPLREIMILSGLTSRWTKPRLWTSPSAAPMGASSSSASR